MLKCLKIWRRKLPVQSWSFKLIKWLIDLLNISIWYFNWKRLQKQFEMSLSLILFLQVNTKFLVDVYHWTSLCDNINILLIIFYSWTILNMLIKLFVKGNINNIVLFPYIMWNVLLYTNKIFIIIKFEIYDCRNYKTHTRSIQILLMYRYFAILKWELFKYSSIFPFQNTIEKWYSM